MTEPGKRNERNIYLSLIYRWATRIRLLWEKAQIKSILRGKFTLAVNKKMAVFMSTMFLKSGKFYRLL
jgi:hypothetical protein